MGAAATAGKIGAMGAGAMARGAGAGAGQLVGGAGRAMKAGGGAKSAEEKKGMKALIDGPKGVLKQGGKLLKQAQQTAGVSFTIAGMLKQSQLFTGFLGAIFQVVGALVDAFLAPMMPTLFKLIGWMAKGVPKMQVMGQKVADWIGAFFRGGLEEKLTMIMDLGISAVSGILNLLWNIIWKTITTLFSFDFWFGIVKALWIIIKVYWQTQWKLVKTFFGFLKNIVTTVWNKLKEKMPWLQHVEDFVKDKIVQPLKNVFSSLKDGIVNAFSNTWDKFMIMWDKFKLFFLTSLNKIKFVNLDDQIKSAQEGVNRREREMMAKGADIKLTVYTNGNGKQIDGSGDDGFDLTESIIGGAVSAAGALSKLKPW